MYLSRRLGKYIVQSCQVKSETLQVVLFANIQTNALKLKPMHARWLNSSSILLSETKTNVDKGKASFTSSHSHQNNAGPRGKTDLVQELPHFRENVQRTNTKVQTESSLSAPDTNNIHPDVIEARSMSDGGYRLPHPIWSNEEVESVKITHRPPVTKVDKIAYYTVKTLRTGFDVFSGYSLAAKLGRLDEKQWVKRIIFLETIAGVPGMVGAMVRHLVSLRKLKRDHGWIHTLLEEAENERMHLMTAMRVGNPGLLMRSAVVFGQGVFVMGFSLAYLLSPRFCHRFVGYLEEEAVKTYTECLKQIDEGKLKMWSRMKAPEIAVEYWKLGDDAMMRDVILAIRADEAHHRTVNHQLSTQKPDEQNPYPPGE